MTIRRVLVAHNRYRRALPSGENAVVDAEVARLEAAGLAVERLIWDSDDVAGFGPGARLGLPLRPTWSAATRRRFREVVAEHRPDVLHLHNPYPLVSPMVVRWAQASGIPVVQTVHNVRHSCLAGTWFRAGAECRDCAGRRLPLPGVRHGCYPPGRAAGSAVAVAMAAHRSTWQLVDRFLAVSASVVPALTAAGIPADRIEVRPNAVDDPGPLPPPQGRGVLYAGRLSEDKGVPDLLAAWAAGRPAGATLRLAGDGPARTGTDASVRWLGLLEPPAVAAELARAAVVVVPSRSPEACPTVVLEAMAAGRPVVATPVGGLPELVDESVGSVARPDRLMAALDEVLADAPARGAAARRRYEERFTPARSLDRLLTVYDEVTR